MESITDMEAPWIISHLALILGFVLAAMVIAQLMLQRRSPAGTIAWLLVIVLIPYIGVPLYLMLGGRKMRRAARRKTDITLVDPDASCCENVPPIDSLLRSYGIPGATRGNKVTLCTTGEAGYAALVELIEQATQRIWITTFILRLDEVGRDIAARLTLRAAEGLEVRLLLDGIGSFRTTRRALAPFVEAGGRFAFFMPILHSPFRGRTNLRNHRKMIIADNRRVLAGGTNIAGEYIGPTPKPGRWRDLSFILEGPATRQYCEVFQSDWEFATGERLEWPTRSFPPAPSDGSGAMVQVVPSGPDVRDDPLYDAIISTTFSARRRLWIVTPYFIPDSALVQALTVAAHRGIDLRIVVPAKSNHIMADLARGTYLREVQAAGGKVMLYAAGMIHAKILLMDDEVAMLGSANMDMRSLFFDYETAMLVYSAAEIRQVEAWIDNLFRNTRIGVPKVGTLRDVCEGAVRMMSPLL